MISKRHTNIFQLPSNEDFSAEYGSFQSLKNVAATSLIVIDVWIQIKSSDPNLTPPLNLPRCSAPFVVFSQHFSAD